VLLCELSEALDQDLGEQSRVSAVGVEIRVKNSDLSPGRAGGKPGEQVDKLVGSEAARVRAVDRGHDRGIEDVDVEVQPVAVELGPIELVEDELGRIHATLPDDRRRGDRQGDCLADLGEVLVVVAAPGVDHVGRVKVRADAVNVGDRRPVAPDGRSEILPGQRPTNRAVAGMAEVGVPVQVSEAEAARGAQRESGSDEQAALRRRPGEASSAYRPGRITPASRAPSSARRAKSPASRSASGALAQPGTLAGPGGRRPRLLGAETSAIIAGDG
jgi:hypothetical protein